MNKAVGVMLVIPALLLSSCGLIPGLGGGTPPLPAQIRVVHAVADAGAVSVAVDGKIINEGQGLAFKEALPANSGAVLYRQVDAGDRKLAITAAGSIDKLLETTLKFEGGKNYTVVVLGTAATGDDGGATPRPLQFKVFEDDIKPNVDATKFRVRWLHAASAAAVTKADVYFTSPNADVSALTPGTTDYGAAASRYLEPTAGSFQVRVMASGSSTPVIDSGAVSFGGGRVYTAVLVNPQAGAASGFVLLEDFRPL